MIRYSVKGDDIDNFLEKIDVFYSKETLWSILLSNGEITIKTDNPRRRLFDLMDGNKDEMVVFETRYSLDNRPLHRAFPEMVYTHFALTKEDEQFADILERHYKRDGCDVFTPFVELENFSWDRVPQVMQALNNRLKLHSWYLMPQTGMVWMLHKGEDYFAFFEMTFFKNKEGKTMYGHHVPRIDFDVCKGFFSWSDKQPVPIEMKESFDRWVKEGDVYQRVLRNDIIY